ncbi:MAG: hypothetical protein ACTHNP_12265 [Solirubrobacterales bacterium]
MEALLMEGGQVENWNDGRLDELSRRMEAGFEAAATKNEMNLRFDEVNARFDRFEGMIVARLSRIDDRLDRQNHTLLVGALGVIAALIANGILG